MAKSASSKAAPKPAATKSSSATEPLSTGKPAPAFLEFFNDEIRDIYWAENHLVKNLPKMQAAASAPSLVNALGEHLEQTKTHVARLEEVFNLLGKPARAKKCDAMEGLIKEGEGCIENTEAGTPLRDLAIVLASRKVEHYEMAAYRGLVRLANSLGLTEVADLLAQTLQEEKQSDELLTEIAESEIRYPSAVK